MDLMEITPKDIRDQNIVFFVETERGRITCNATPSPDKSPNEVQISLTVYHVLKAKGLL